MSPLNGPVEPVEPGRPNPGNPVKLDELDNPTALATGGVRVLRPQVRRPHPEPPTKPSPRMPRPCAKPCKQN